MAELIQALTPPRSTDQITLEHSSPTTRAQFKRKAGLPWETPDDKRLKLHRQPSIPQDSIMLTDSLTSEPHSPITTSVEMEPDFGNYIKSNQAIKIEPLHLRSDNSNLEARVARLESICSEIPGIKQKCNKLREENTQLQQKYNSVDHDLKELQIYHKELQIFHEELQISHMKLQNSHKRLELSHMKLQISQKKLQISQEELQISQEELQISQKALQISMKRPWD